MQSVLVFNSLEVRVSDCSLKVMAGISRAGLWYQYEQWNSQLVGPSCQDDIMCHPYLGTCLLEIFIEVLKLARVDSGHSQ